MTENPPHDHPVKPQSHLRRWLLPTVALTLLLAGGGLAWMYRPLTSAERKVLGSWETPVVNRLPGVVREELTLTADRRFLRSQCSAVGAIETHGGTWWASGRTLLLTRPPSPLHFLRDTWRGRALPEANETEFEIVEDSPLQLIGAGQLWNRPDSKPSPRQSQP